MRHDWWVRPLEWLVVGLILGTAIENLRPTHAVSGWVWLAVGLVLLGLLSVITWKADR